MIHPFDAATAVRQQEGRWCGATDRRYWAFVGPFGGATAATLLRAVLAQPEREGDPAALTVNYCAPVAEGPFDLDVRLLRATRSTQHWSVGLSQGDGEPAAFATVFVAQRRAGWAHDVAAPPEVSSPEDLQPYDSTSTADWVRQYEFRFAAGSADLARQGDPPGPTRTEVWMSDALPRQVDALSLASMADAFFGRIFLARRAIVPFGTVSMTTYFHADAEDLAAERAERVLGVADARRFHKSYGDQTGELWSPSGRLLATTQQLFYFKA